MVKPHVLQGGHLSTLTFKLSLCLLVVLDKLIRYEIIWHFAPLFYRKKNTLCPLISYYHNFIANARGKFFMFWYFSTSNWHYVTFLGHLWLKRHFLEISKYQRKVAYYIEIFSPLTINCWLCHCACKRLAYACSYKTY